MRAAAADAWGLSSPAAEDVDVARRRRRLAPRRFDQFGRHAPPGEALDQHAGVAPVAVGAEQLGVEQRDPDGAVAGLGAQSWTAASTVWKAV